MYLRMQDYTDEDSQSHAEKVARQPVGILGVYAHELENRRGVVWVKLKGSPQHLAQGVYVCVYECMDRRSLGLTEGLASAPGTRRVCMCVRIHA